MFWDSNHFSAYGLKHLTLTNLSVNYYKIPISALKTC